MILNSIAITGLTDITKGNYFKLLNKSTTKENKAKIADQIIMDTLGAGAVQNFRDNKRTFIQAYREKLFAMLPYINGIVKNSPIVQKLNDIAALCDIAATTDKATAKEISKIADAALAAYYFLSDINNFAFVATLAEYRGLNATGKVENTQKYMAKDIAGYSLTNKLDINAEQFERLDITGTLKEVYIILSDNFCLLETNAAQMPLTICPMFFMPRIAKSNSLRQKVLAADAQINEIQKRIDKKISAAKSKGEDIDETETYSLFELKQMHRFFKGVMFPPQANLVYNTRDSQGNIIPKERSAASAKKSIAKSKAYYMDRLHGLCRQKEKNLQAFFQDYADNVPNTPYRLFLDTFLALANLIDYKAISARHDQNQDILVLDNLMPALPANKYYPTDKGSKTILRGYAAITIAAEKSKEVKTTKDTITLTVEQDNSLSYYTISKDKNFKNQDALYLTDNDIQILAAIYSVCTKTHSLTFSNRQVYEEIKGLEHTNKKLKPNNKDILEITNRIENVLPYLDLAIDFTDTIVAKEDKADRAKTLASKNRQLQQAINLTDIQKLTAKQPLLSIMWDFDAQTDQEKFKVWTLSNLPILCIAASFKKQMLSIPFEDFSYNINKGNKRTLEQAMLKQNVLSAINDRLHMHNNPKYKNDPMKITYDAIIDKRLRTSNDAPIKRDRTGNYIYTKALELKQNKKGNEKNQRKYYRYKNDIDTFMQEFKEVGVIVDFEQSIIKPQKRKEYKDGYIILDHISKKKKENEKQKPAENAKVK